ncbi:MAG: hypothetical protein SFU53_03190 [Terrimicrobiaceae bacterium]|nr:hypothetical protein [Terrimicrobiaceae bacterium]
MKLVPILLCLLLAGCMTTPVSQSGGLGAITIENTNVNAIIGAAQVVFPDYGYSIGPSDYPAWIAFDKPGGAFGNIMWGSYGRPVSIRARLVMTPIGGTNDYRVAVRVSRVLNNGEFGFEDDRRISGLWAGEFRPILRRIESGAAGAGPVSGTSL